MSLNHRHIPPNLHLKELNPDLDLEDFDVTMPGKGGTVLKADAQGRMLGGVSSFGFGGTNAHVLVEAGDTTDTDPNGYGYGQGVVYDRQRFSWTPVSRTTNDQTPVDPLEEWLHSDTWQLIEQSATSTNHSSASWLIIDSAMQGGTTSPKTQLPMHNSIPLTNQFAWCQSPTDVKPKLHTNIVYVVRHSDGSTSDDRLPNDLLQLGKVLRKIDRGNVVIVTQGVQDVDGTELRCQHNEAACTTGAAVWGFARTMRAELAHLRCICVDIEHGTMKRKDWLADVINTSVPLADGDIYEPEIALRNENIYTRRLERCSSRIKDNLQDAWIDQNKAYVVTGGLGGLGLLAARHLLNNGANDISLLSRSGRVPAGSWQLWMDVKRRIRPDQRLRVVRCDVGSVEGCRRAMRLISSTGHLVGAVLHCAGVLRDMMLDKMSIADVQAVCEPKVNGSWHMHHHTLGQPGAKIVLYSSVAALLGNVGQANYAYANGWMDGLSILRQECGLWCSSIQWGPWAEVGMAANGIGPSDDGTLSTIPNVLGLDALDVVMCGNWPKSSVIKAQWSTLAKVPHATHLLEKMTNILKEESELNANTLPTGSPHVQTQFVRAVMDANTEERASMVESMLFEVVGDLLPPQDEEPLTVNTPLMDAGMDSLGATELAAELKDMLGPEHAVPSTLLFSYPTIARLRDFIITRITASAGNLGISTSLVPVIVGDTSTPIGIVGMSCRFPGQKTDGPEAFWEMLCDGADSVREVPASRWDIDSFYDQTRGAPGKMYTRDGGFIDGLDMFDHSLFGIVASEAKQMDPQQRLLLEISYDALHRSGYTQDTLRGSNVGVFVASTANGYAKVTAEKGSRNVSAYAATGTHNAITSNRISHALGLEGPSLTVDTACSSSLVAFNLACQALRSHECDVAVVAAVNTLVDPDGYIGACNAGMLSPRGRCHTFDASADGYARAEGCGAVVLQRVTESGSTAQEHPGAGICVPEGQQCYALVRGIAVNQDGRSANLTAPNGLAQEALHTRVMQVAKDIEPRDVAMIETHGTGTALGDPIEVGALKAVYGGDRGRDRPLALGAVKTNVGHLETAAGMAGLIKLVMCLNHGHAPSNLHLNELNPDLDLEDFDVTMPGKGGTVLKADAQGRMLGGVSSFGFGGTNAHVLVEAGDTTDTDPNGYGYGQGVVYDRQRFSWTPVSRTTNDQTPVDPLEEWLHSDTWQLIEQSATSTNHSSASWLIIDSAMQGGTTSPKTQLPMHNSIPLTNQFAWCQSPTDVKPKLHTNIVYIVRHSDGSTSDDRLPNDLLQLGKVLRKIDRGNVVIVTQGVQDVDGTELRCQHNEAACTTGAAVWGFARTMRAELAHLRCICVDIEHGTMKRKDWLADVINTSVPLADGDIYEPEIALRNENIYTRRLERCSSRIKDNLQDTWIDQNKAYVVTGGLGGLGLLAARHLLNNGAKDISLLSRSGRVPAGSWQLWMDVKRRIRPDQRLRVVRCDVGSVEGCRRAMRLISSTGHLVGAVLHCAGVVRVRMLDKMSIADVQAVCEPKVNGSWHMHHHTLGQPGAKVVLYSSISALLGFRGQANYAYANGWMDGLSILRQECGLWCSSIQWGPWAEVGMAANGIGPSDDGTLSTIPNVLGLDALDVVMCGNWPKSSVIKAQWSTLAKVPHATHLLEKMTNILKEESELNANTLPTGSPHVQTQFVRAVMDANTEERASMVESMLFEVVGDLLPPQDEEPLTVNTPLMDAGMDSLGATELAAELKDMLGPEHAVPSTLMFSYPTIARLREFIITRITASAGDLGMSTLLVPVIVGDTSTPIGIVGMSCRFPGQKTDGPEAFWEMLCDGADSVREVPASRWDIDSFYDQTRGAPGKMYTRDGGFIDGLDMFDHSLFGIVASEAKQMDPQQRLLLEISYDALHRSGYTLDTLRGSNVGVFVASTANGYAKVTAEKGSRNVSAYAATGTHNAITSNRISHALGLEGPSLTVDTACSSSLVAFNLACQALRSHECDVAVVAAVNTLVDPDGYIGACNAGMLSPRGRCHTFDASADGYARAEGCGAVVLQRVTESGSTAQEHPGAGICVPEGQQCYALVRGIAVNQDGRSANLTAPNGLAQEAVHTRVMQVAKDIEPRDVAMIETHGTGTALGDPIEVGALKAVYGGDRGRDRPLALGAVKTNVGHLETAAGMAGLIKLVMCLNHGHAPSNLHLKELNPDLDLEDFDVTMPGKGGTVLKADAQGRMLGGVSSFGFGGTNAHVLVEAGDTTDTDPNGYGYGQGVVYDRQRFSWTPVAGDAVSKDGDGHDTHWLHQAGWHEISTLPAHEDNEKRNWLFVRPLGCFRGRRKDAQEQCAYRQHRSNIQGGNAHRAGLCS